MNGCHNITALAKELGLERKTMYLWRAELDPESVIKRKTGPPGKSRETELEQEVSRLKRVLADKTLELDFFRGALQKIEERRRQSKSSGGKTSTTTSGE
jgi:transposase